MFNRILLKNFTSLSILQLSNYIIPLITLPYLLRVLGPEKYGLMNFAAALAAYLGVLVDYGFNLSIPREISIHRNDKRKLTEIFSSVLIIKGFFFIVSFMLLFLLTSTITKFNTEQEIYLLSFMGVLGQLFFPGWFFQGIEKMHLTSIITISIRSIVVIFIFLLIKSTNDLLLLILLNSLTYILIGFISLLTLYVKFSINFKLQGFETIKYYIKEGLHLFISSFSINLYTTSSVIILGLLAGDRFVGYFSAADKIRIAVQNFFSSVTQTIYPHIAGLFQHQDLSKGFGFLRKVFKSAGTLNLFLCMLLFIFSDKIILLIAGESYSRSIIVLKIISILPLIIFISNLAGIQAMINLGYKKEFTKIIISAAVISIVISLILVPYLKEIGISISMLVTEAFVTLGMVFFLLKKYKFKVLSGVKN